MIWAYKTSIFRDLVWINSNMVLIIKDQVQLSPSSVRQKVYLIYQMNQTKSVQTDQIISLVKLTK